MVLFILGMLVFITGIILLIFNRMNDRYEVIPPIVLSILTYETIAFYNYGYILFIPSASKVIMLICSSIILTSLITRLISGISGGNILSFAYIVPCFFEIVLFFSTFQDIDLSWLLIAQKTINYVVPISLLLALFYLFFYVGRQYEQNRIINQNAREKELEVERLGNQATLWISNAAIVRLQDASKDLILKILGTVYLFLNSEYPKRHFTDKYYLDKDRDFLKLFQGLPETTVELLVERLRFSDLYLLTNRIDLDEFQHLLVPELFSHSTDYSSSVFERLIEDLPGQVLDRIRRDSEEDPSNIKQTKLFQSQIRELLHSFITPLNTIDRAVKLINMSRDDNNFEDVLNENLQIIASNLSLSYSLLYAYRGLALLDFTSSNRTLDIKEVFSLIIKSLNSQYQKNVFLNIIGGDFSFDGLSNEIIIALVLPLLQNAVEASSNNDTVDIEEFSNDDSHYLVITNSYNNSVTSDQLSVDGFSTKMEGAIIHSGLGLPSVRHISQELGVDFSVELRDERFIAKLKFFKKNFKAE